jgi:hypothetical protein
MTRARACVPRAYRTEVNSQRLDKYVARTCVRTVRIARISIARAEVGSRLT